MKNKVRYPGRFSQLKIYLGKFLRMFVYQNDWKMLVMAALIAGLVTIVIGPGLFRSQEGTVGGCFALVCVCVWNGFFNSIQVICREREIVKREHRSGMHISSYVGAHMIYQLLICFLQTVIFFVICRFTGVVFPNESLITGHFVIDFGLAMLLITYTADMVALFVSSIVRNTTTAMTVMPFLLIFQLVFSGQAFSISGPLARLKNLTIIWWGQRSLCALGNYNAQPMMSLWNMLWKFRGIEVGENRPVQMFIDYMVQNDLKDSFLEQSGHYNTVAQYVFSAENVFSCWTVLLLMTLLFAVLSVCVLRLVDKDKR